MVGQNISQYKIIEEVGRGGMGIVYKAHDGSLDRIVALKFLPHYLTSDANEKERFYHEARAASSLNHPNITTIYEIKEFENQIYLAMEFVEGRTIKKLIEPEVPSIKKVLDLAIQICEGLAAAHEKSVVHRDIKSENIMVTAKGQVKIMDFGLAKVKGASKLTKAGSTLGTAAYMSPEQAQGEEVDHRSDIFSFGVVLYELLTGKLPFRGEHQAALLYSLVNEDPTPIARYNEKVTPEIERIILKALAKDPEDRYQHADEMLADLRRERKHLEYAKAGYATSTISKPAIPVAKAGPKKGVMKYIVIAAGLILIVLGLVIFNPFNFQISTQKSTAASGKSTLAVMYFEDIPDPADKDHTGEMLTNLLTTSLFQTKEIEVISRERLYDIQKELGSADVNTISPPMATKIAQRAGVSMMLLGSILQKQPSLAVTYRLIEIQSGKILSTQRLSGFLPDRIFALVDTLAQLVKDDLQVTSAPSAPLQSVATVTTKSPEAYRSYLEGIELNNRFYTSEATAAFRRAIELDSNFAMAYFQMATVNLNAITNEEFVNSVKKAYALSGNVTERERLLIQATYAGSVEVDIPKAISTLENLIQKYPHEMSAYNGLAFLYQSRGEYLQANETARRALQDDSLNKNLWNQWAYSCALLNRRQDAMNAIDRYLALAPAEANPYDSKGDMYAMFDDRDSAVIWWKKAITFRADFASATKLLMNALVRNDTADMKNYMSNAAAALHEDETAFRDEGIPYFLTFYGKITKARTDFLRILSSQKSKGRYDAIVGDHRYITMLDCELHDYPAMVQHAQEYSDEMKKNDPKAIIYGRTVVAIALHMNGNSQGASKLFDSVRNDARGNEPDLGGVRYASAIMSFEDGNYRNSLEQMDSALQLSPPHHAPLYYHAVSLLKLGRFDEAINELRRLVRYSPTLYTPFDLDVLPFSDYSLIGSVKAHYWLGVAFEQTGLKDEAMKEYEKFLDIWKNADFKSPEIQDAKTRLLKLKGVASR